jgi:hypothetical protein
VVPQPQRRQVVKLQLFQVMRQQQVQPQRQQVVKLR